MGPVFSQSWQNVSQGVRSKDRIKDSDFIAIIDYLPPQKWVCEVSPCDGAINIRNDYLVIPVPQINGALTAACALVLGGDAEDHIIWAVF